MTALELFPFKFRQIKDYIWQTLFIVQLDPFDPFEAICFIPVDTGPFDMEDRPHPLVTEMRRNKAKYGKFLTNYEYRRENWTDFFHRTEHIRMDMMLVLELLRTIGKRFLHVMEKYEQSRIPVPPPLPPPSEPTIEELWYKY